MKILNPDNTTHQIVLQPRFDPTGSIILSFTNEVDKVVSEVLNTYTFENGVMSISFDLTVLEGNRYFIKALENNSVIYRGRAFATSQIPQDYSLTKGKYIYAE